MFNSRNKASRARAASLGIAAVSVVILASGASAAPPKTEISCVEQLPEFLAMGITDFDQGVKISESGNRVEWGWRSVYRKPGCVSAAADLIETWRSHHISELNAKQIAWMRFHEGQLRAEAGQTALAKPLLESGYSALPADPSWKFFVGAILAFINDDRAGLLDARAKLLALPEPPNWSHIQQLFREQAGQEMAWPQNIESVDHLILCFGRGYPLGLEDAQRCPNDVFH